MTTEHVLPGLPFPLIPAGEARWVIDAEAGTVSASASPRSDIFIDPASVATPDAAPVLNAATLLGVPPEGDFQLSARVTVEFAATFDAGVLLLWFDERHWGKLCFELSPGGEPMIVSVVARGVADDANAFVVGAPSVWLRLSRMGDAFACHASLDGELWHLVRHFAIDLPAASPSVGLAVQSPTGDGCHVTFDHVRFVQERLVDLRNGS